jgi:hypothetical protein
LPSALASTGTGAKLGQHVLIKYPGKLGDASVKVLVDSGGTHSFCSIQLLRRDGLEVMEYTKIFRIHKQVNAIF